MCIFFRTIQGHSAATLIQVSCNSQQVEHVNMVKLLGLYLDNCLKFNIHTALVKCKVIVEMKALARIHNFIDGRLTLQLPIYRTLIAPHFNYAAIVYVVMSTTYSSKLSAMQKRCHRIYLKAEWDTPLPSYILQQYYT